MSPAATTDTTEADDREVAPGVYRFGTARINWYVVEDDDALTVVDAGLPAHYPQLAPWLDRHGYTLDDVDALVLTHGDADHAGFARHLVDRGSSAYCHPDDHHHLRDLPHGPPAWFLRNLWRPGFLRYVVEMVRDGIRDVDPVTDVEPMTDGDVLDVPGSPRVIHVPGHTPGSCALHLEDRDVLIAGDAIVTRDIYRNREGDPQLMGPADEDTALARRSLDELAGLGDVTLLPGHGNPWRGDVDTALDIAS